MKDSLKNTLVRILRSGLQWAGHVERMGDEKQTGRVQMAGKWRDKRRGEDRECDGRTALRKIWKEWVESGEDRRS